MTGAVHTIAPSRSLAAAYGMMRRHRIRQLPVLPHLDPAARPGGIAARNATSRGSPDSEVPIRLVTYP
jgi:CBS domain-containing protein